MREKVARKVMSPWSALTLGMRRPELTIIAVEQWVRPDGQPDWGLLIRDLRTNQERILFDENEWEHIKRSGLPPIGTAFGAPAVGGLAPPAGVEKLIRAEKDLVGLYGDGLRRQPTSVSPPAAKRKTSKPKRLAPHVSDEELIEALLTHTLENVAAKHLGISGHAVKARMRDPRFVRQYEPVRIAYSQGTKMLLATSTDYKKYGHSPVENQQFARAQGQIMRDAFPAAREAASKAYEVGLGSVDRSTWEGLGILEEAARTAATEVFELHGLHRPGSSQDGGTRD